MGRSAQLFADFFSPYGMLTNHKDYLYAPPQITKINFFDDQGNFHLRPFIYRQEAVRDPKTLRFVYKGDKSKKDFIHFFIRGESYEMLGFIKSDLHFFGVKEGKLFLLGTDIIGRDLLSRIIFGGRVSLSIGLIGAVVRVSTGVSFQIACMASKCVCVLCVHVVVVACGVSISTCAITREREK